ncbi:MAG: hypothetical protein ABJB16_06670 [Saprospiraceae bacterium]
MYNTRCYLGQTGALFFPVPKDLLLTEHLIVAHVVSAEQELELKFENEINDAYNLQLWWV